MQDTIKSAIDFYESHPISADIIVAELQAARGALDGLVPEDLFAYDQDHYGGLEANEKLAAAVGLQAGQRVADFCAGLGGPARYFAHRHGVHVTGIELTPARVAGAARLTKLVGLEDRVQVVEGDVMAVPLDDGSQDAVVSQEAFLHVPDLARAFREAFRILKPGGRFAFTTWTAPQPLSAADRELMWAGMAVADVFSRDEQRQMLRDAGFVILATEDVTQWWGGILAERLAMYQKLRTKAQTAATPAGHDAFYVSYVRFVEMMQTGALGGVRMTARRPV